MFRKAAAALALATFLLGAHATKTNTTKPAAHNTMKAKAKTAEICLHGIESDMIIDGSHPIVIIIDTEVYDCGDVDTNGEPEAGAEPIGYAR